MFAKGIFKKSLLQKGFLAQNRAQKGYRCPSWSSHYLQYCTNRTDIQTDGWMFPNKLCIIMIALQLGIFTHLPFGYHQCISSEISLHVKISLEISHENGPPELSYKTPRGNRTYPETWASRKKDMCIIFNVMVSEY